MKQAFERGDIIVVTFDPVSGHEQRGKRPALVLTPKAFNQLGDTLVAPITQGGDFARHAGFAVNLSGSGCKTQGAVLINKMRTMDLSARQAKRIERAPAEVIEEALGRLAGLLA